MALYHIIEYNTIKQHHTKNIYAECIKTVDCALQVMKIIVICNFFLLCILYIHIYAVTVYRFIERENKMVKIVLCLDNIRFGIIVCCAPRCQSMCMCMYWYVCMCASE